MENSITPANKEEIRVVMKYIIFIIAVCHAYKVICLVVNGKVPMLVDSGFNIQCFTMLIVNWFLFNLSKLFQFCFWHRQPIIFSVYYEASRLVINTDELHSWIAGLQLYGTHLINIIDTIVLASLFLRWVIGYINHKCNERKANERCDEQS